MSLAFSALNIGEVLSSPAPTSPAHQKSTAFSGMALPPDPATVMIAAKMIVDTVATIHEAITRPPTEEEKRRAQQEERDKAAMARQEQEKKDLERIQLAVLDRLGPEGPKLFAEIRALPLEQRLVAIHRLMATAETISIVEERQRVDHLAQASVLAEGHQAAAEVNTARRRVEKAIGTIILSDADRSPATETSTKLSDGGLSLVSGEASLALGHGEHAPRITITGPIKDLKKSDDGLFGNADVTLEYANGTRVNFTGMRLAFGANSKFEPHKGQDNNPADHDSNLPNAA